MDNRIGVDLLGSDNDPASLLDAAASLLPRLPKAVRLVLIGHPELEASIPKAFDFLPAEEAIGMDEHPLRALRKKKNSSTLVGLRALKEGKIDAFVSSGNTGALVSASKMLLGTFPGILRPALLALMPTKAKPVAVLDVGGGVQAKAAQLVQFAKLGAAYQMARGIEQPRIGILNIGSEASKGTSEIRLAYRRLEKLPSFAGNIEGTLVFDGAVDVLVTDGFTGNVFLKTAEGIANLVLDRLADIPEGPRNEIQKHLNDLKRHLHYSEYPGALLCGVNGAVVKCHGYSTPEAFANGLAGAVEFASCSFVKTIKSRLESLSQ